MRVGVIIDPVAESPGLAGLQRQAEAAVEAGLDLCWLRERPDPSAPAWSAPVLAAAVGAATPSIRIVVQIAIGDHPVELAEELIVADLTIGGRLGVVIEPGSDAALVDETLTLMLASFAPTPFEHHGERWSVAPGGEPSAVLPDPAQPELPIGMLGTSDLDPARRHGVPPVADRDDDAATAQAAWAELEGEIGAARHRWARMARRDPTAAGDVDGLVDSLHHEAAAWRLGTAVFDLATLGSLSDRLAMIDVLGRDVRPRVQLPSLPDGVVEMWKRRRAEART